MHKIQRWTVYALVGLAATTALAVAQQAGFKERSLQFEKTGRAEPVKGVTKHRRPPRAGEAGRPEPFKGGTTDGPIRTGLFAIKSTGVSTDPVRRAADAFLARLKPDQPCKTTS